MSKILIAYGSTTGNTAEVADWIAENLRGKGLDVTAEDCAGLSFDDLCAGYDLVVLGSPTYGDDPIEIQEDIEPLLDDLEKTSISGKKVAVFGCGDRSYTHFCGVVDVIEGRVKDCGGSLVVDSLRVDTPHDSFRDEVDVWSDEVAASV